MSAGDVRRSKKKQHETALGFFITVLIKCKMQGRGALQRQPPRDRPRGRTPKRQRRRHRTDLSTFFQVFFRKAAASITPERVCDGIAAHMNLRHGLKGPRFLKPDQRYAVRLRAGGRIMWNVECGMLNDIDAGGGPRSTNNLNISFMEMTINVRVDVSERVVALAERLLGGLNGCAGNNGNDVGAVEPDKAEKPVKVEEPVKAESAEEPVKAESAGAVKAPTAEDVRQAMVETRKRIIGEGWDDPESDSYKFYHRTLVSMFKTTATLHGAPKPSQLAEDERQAFIDDLAKICKDERGKLTNGQEVPF